MPPAGRGRAGRDGLVYAPGPDREAGFFFLIRLSEFQLSLMGILQHYKEWAAYNVSAFKIATCLALLVGASFSGCDDLDNLVSDLAGFDERDDQSNGDGNGDSLSSVPAINYMTFDSGSPNTAWPFIEEFAFVDDVIGDSSAGDDADISSVGVAHNQNNIFFVVRTDNVHTASNNYFYEINFNSDLGSFYGTFSQGPYDQVGVVPIAYEPEQCADGPEVMNFAAEGNATIVAVPVGDKNPLSCYSATPEHISSVTVSLFDSSGTLLDELEFGTDNNIDLDQPDDSFVHLERTTAPAGDSNAFHNDTGVPVYIDGESDLGGHFQGVALATDSTGEDLFVGLMTTDPIGGVNYSYIISFFQNSELRATILGTVFFSLSNVLSFNSDDDFGSPRCDFGGASGDIEGFDSPTGSAGYRFSVRLDLAECLGLDPDEEFDSILFTVSDSVSGNYLDQFDFYNFSFADGT